MPCAGPNLFGWSLGKRSRVEKTSSIRILFRQDQKKGDWAVNRESRLFLRDGICRSACRPYGGGSAQTTEHIGLSLSRTSRLKKKKVASGSRSVSAPPLGSSCLELSPSRCATPNGVQEKTEVCPHKHPELICLISNLERRAFELDRLFRCGERGKVVFHGGTQGF